MRKTNGNVKKILCGNNTKISETITENLFRKIYGADVFIEKSAIPNTYGFISKKGTEESGFPDFFKDCGSYCIVVEAKANAHKKAENEVKYYMKHNNINKDIIGIAISGQEERTLTATFYLREVGSSKFIQFPQKKLISLDDIETQYNKTKAGEIISTADLVHILKQLNDTFNTGNKIRDTDRSLFFSGLMIALKNDNFRNTYKNIMPPSANDVAHSRTKVIEAHNLNNAILEAITQELEGKINNLSKEYSWKDKFSFIKNIDYCLEEYKSIIKLIETKIFYPFQNQEKQDILGRAYKIFLSRAGKVDNKNIILTPDHIKELMVKLARLSKDDIVLDTCTGSGGFLMEAMETMIHLAEGDDEKIRSIKEKQLIGFEIDPVLFALACSNMFLHGDGRTNLLYRSSLINENKSGIVNSSDQELLEYILSLKPTKVIINPPYEKNSAIKFTIQALDYLPPNGRLIIIMPTPTLTQNHNSLTPLVLSKAKLDFVIKMPNKLFTEQKRTVNTSIFGFTKTPHNVSDEVLFYDCSDDGFVSVQHKGRIDKYNTWTDKQEQLLDSVFNLKEIEHIAVKKKIYSSDGVLNCAGVQARRDGNYEMVHVSDIFDIREGTLPSDDCIQGKYPFITASEEWKTHCTYSEDCEAIVFAAKAAGSLGRTHYIQGKFVASNLCFILTAKKDTKYPVDLMFYNSYFTAIRAQVVSDLAEGTSKLTISDNMLADYYIDYVPYEMQKEFVKKRIKPLSQARKKFEKQKQDTLSAMSDIIW